MVVLKYLIIVKVRTVDFICSYFHIILKLIHTNIGDSMIRLNYDSIMKQIKNNKKITRYIIFIIGLFLTAFAYNLFFVPSNIVVGGVSGLAIIFDSILNINTSIFIFIANIILLVIGYILLGKNNTLKSILGSILFPFFTYITQNITNYINIADVDLLMLTVFGSIISGVGGGLIFKAGYNSGGIDILLQICSKYFHMSIGKSNLIVNILIILTSGFIFGINNMFYAIIALYIMSILNDKILLGIDNNKTVFIITEHQKEIKKFIINKLEHGVTVLGSKGGFTNEKKDVLMLVIPSNEYIILREAIHIIDDKAFFVVIDSYQAFYGNV